MLLVFFVRSFECCQRHFFLLLSPVLYNSIFNRDQVKFVLEYQPKKHKHFYAVEKSRKKSHRRYK
jgi:hypothetical protein